MWLTSLVAVRITAHCRVSEKRAYGTDRQTDDALQSARGLREGGLEVITGLYDG